MSFDIEESSSTVWWRRTIGFRDGVAFLIATVLVAFTVAVPAQARDSAAPSCKTLERVDLSTIEDAPTKVVSAEIVDARGAVPNYCQVQGYIAPQIGFELKLPTSKWNSKFIEIVPGGLGGSAKAAALVAWCNDALRRGYACLAHDLGHSSTSGAGWAYNSLQAEIDYGYRATHVAGLAGKAIEKRYYGKRPDFSYMMGCSGGGRQGLTSAQRFPWDFDGIIAMDPGPTLSFGFLTALWNALAMTSEEGEPLLTSGDLKVLHSAVVSQCDTDDGLKDGIIGDPRTCNFDPATLLCKGSKEFDCLSVDQVEGVRKVYSGPVTSKGESLNYGSLPGAEDGDVFAGIGPLKEMAGDYFRFMGLIPDPGPTWEPHDFDFDKDYKRLGMMEMLYASDNPDLRKFKAAGGKMIIAQGWHDSGSWLPRSTVDYYEMVVKAMGGQAHTQDFVRLFMIPGRAHCGGGPGANAFDYLGYLEDWVEKGQAPDVIIGAHVESEDPGDFIRLPVDFDKVTLTRPVYPYPLQARYKGAGDPNDHQNFEGARAQTNAGSEKLAGEPSPRAVVAQDGTIRASDVVVPASEFASREANANVARRAASPNLPTEIDIATRRKIFAENDGRVAERMKQIYAVDVKREVIGGVSTEVITPKSGVAPANARRVLINLHGGGFMWGDIGTGQVESIPFASVGKRSCP